MSNIGEKIYKTEKQYSQVESKEERIEIMLDLSLLSSYKFNVLFNSYNVYSKDRVGQEERERESTKRWSITNMLYITLYVLPIERLPLFINCLHWKLFHLELILWIRFTFFSFSVLWTYFWARQHLFLSILFHFFSTLIERKVICHVAI